MYVFTTVYRHCEASSDFNCKADTSDMVSVSLYDNES